MINQNRRSFLKNTVALATTAIVAPGFTYQSMFNNLGSIDKFGIQLYSLKDDMAQDAAGVIKTLASYGYQHIEGFEGSQGLFWGMGHLEFKKHLDGVGTSMVSAHCNIYENFEEKAAQSAEIGVNYLICPWVGPQKSKDDWQTVCDHFNDAGEICRKNGIKFAYHNHAYSFVPFSGMIPQDYMMEHTDPALVDHQMDIYWVITGGADPIEYLKKYADRYKLCHIKDRMKNSGTERMASCHLGTGIIDYPSILSEAQNLGIEYFIVEQERYDNSTPLESAALNAQYMRSLQF